MDEVSLTAVAMECMLPRTCLTIVAAFACGFGGVACGFGGGLGVAGDLGDGGGHLLHGGGGLLGLLALLVDAAVDLVAGGAHGGGAAGERAGGVDDGADDGAEVGLHLLHGVGEVPIWSWLWRSSGFAGEVAGGDGVGALGDEIDGVVMRRARKKETMPPMSAPRIVAIQRVRGWSGWRAGAVISLVGLRASAIAPDR